MSDDPFTVLVSRAEAYWRARGGRMTQVRVILCQVMAARTSAFVAEEVGEWAREIDRGISSASVYRALSDLVAAGLLAEIEAPSERRRYALVLLETNQGHLEPI